MHQFTVEEKDSTQRLDRFIARLLPLAPKSFIYKALRNKDIRLNGRKAAGNEPLKPGDVILIRFPDVQYRDLGGKEETIEKTAEKEKKEFPSSFGTILYEDEDLIFADKKCGVLSQKAKPEDVSINEALLSFCGGKTDLFTPSVCNRLDRGTSGLIIFAKTYKGAREMAKALKERSAGKYYLAAVGAEVKTPGHLKARLLKDEKENRVTVLPAESAGGDLIETAYEPLMTVWVKGNPATLLKIDLLTGKTHQIRAHMASCGMPVLGDAKYGKKGDGERFHVNRLMLHSYELVLPGRGQFKTEVPEEFGKLFPGWKEI